jgi:CRISPR system Cascade subunit CasC
MTAFVQIHLLVDYPAANLNRDDSGRPKTVIYGGAERLRVSSQSVKRALRTGPVFQAALAGALGTRAQSFGDILIDILTKPPHGLERAVAVQRARAVVEHDRLGKLKAAPKGREEIADTEQLAHLGPDEIERLEALAERVVAGGALDDNAMLVLTERPRAADIAMFGRMLADNPGHNVDASVQIAHAFTTHAVEVEDDYFTAVDELKQARREADRGAGFVGVQQFGAGLFYQYACLDTRTLLANLSGDVDLAARAAAALVEGLATTSPKGKQNSFASRAIANYALVEVGPQQPRTLASAFQTPVRGEGQTAKSVEALRKLRRDFAVAYGPGSDEQAEMEIGGAGTLAALTALAGKAVRDAAAARDA